MAAADTLLEQREIDLLRWRSRRGLVENDLYIERFFTTYGHQLTQRHADAWTALMNLADNDLMDLFLYAHDAAPVVDLFARVFYCRKSIAQK